MRLCFVILLLTLSLGGCRLSCTAEKLAFTLQADEPGYLTTEDPTLYETDATDDSAPVE